MTASEQLVEMRTKYRGGHFLKVSDFTKEQLNDFIQFAVKLKKMQKEGKEHHYLAGKTLAMIFEKSSTRTRISFEVGMNQLGGKAMFLNSNDMQLGTGETIADTANVMSRYVDGVMIRTFGHEIVEEMAENSTVPIINGLTDSSHPCQVLADLLTIYEKKGTFEGLKFAFVGDANNMSRSLAMGCAIIGIDCYVAMPNGYEFDADFMNRVQKIAEKSGTTIIQTNDKFEAVKDADIVYTDVWASMGFEEEMEARAKAFADYQVNDELLSVAKDDVIFMHCLPARRGEEVSDDVIDGPHSVVFDQAENRLHAQKAILASIM